MIKFDHQKMYTIDPKQNVTAVFISQWPNVISNPHLKCNYIENTEHDFR